jgi:hypothetical protein
MTRCVAILLVLAISACATRGPSVGQKLDPETGVTVHHARTPLVLYRDSNARAAYAKDFVYLAPVAVNQLGEYRYYLWLGIWSSMDDTVAPNQRDGFDSIVLYADGEPFRLDVAGWTLSAINVSQPVYNKPTATAADAYYMVTLDQIRLMAEASDIRMQTGASRPVTYELWDSQKSALANLQDFVRAENF